MSRLTRYMGSLKKFIKENNYMKEIKDIATDDYIYPILLLTIMNSQSKKHKVNTQGYHVATAVHMLNILNSSPSTPDKDTLIFESNKAIFNNMDNIKNSLNRARSFDIYYYIMDMYHKYVSEEYILGDPEIVMTPNKPNNEIQKWYLRKQNKKLNSRYKQADRESYNEYLNKKVHTIAEFAIASGWILGGGLVADIEKVKRMAKYFSMMYKFYKDFKNLDNDLDCKERYKQNYIINFGLQESYELFMYNKRKFIEESIELNMYTYTLREIIESIDSVVDGVIDDTSPDLKSNFSNAL